MENFDAPGHINNYITDSSTKIFSLSTDSRRLISNNHICRLNGTLINEIQGEGCNPSTIQAGRFVVQACFIYF